MEEILLSTAVHKQNVANGSEGQNPSSGLMPVWHGQSDANEKKCYGTGDVDNIFLCLS